MAERKRSKDGHREPEEIPGAKGGVSQQGWSGGGLQRGISSEDELKRAKERPAGSYRVTKPKEQE